MLDVDLHSPVTLKRLRSGVAGAHIDSFAEWLDQRRYKRSTIRSVLQSLAAWTDWLRSSGKEESDFAEAIMECRAELRSRSRARYQRGPNGASICAARHFVRYLQEKGVAPQQSVSDNWPLLHEFCSWMRQNRGLTEATLNAYVRVLTAFLKSQGDAPRAYTAEAVRGFVMERAKRHGVSYTKITATAVRAFLQFLGATGQCRAGMDFSLPAFASWTHSSVPRYITSTDVDRVIASCSNNCTGLRNRAILLLLVRLGLRAGDIVQIRLSDIDWKNGLLAVCGKGRRREFLPLPQEVGDAILIYLQRARPSTRAIELFIRTIPPFRQLSTQAVSGLVATSLRRAGVDAPNYGAHVLRHTAATTMLQHGASLAGIGAVLRHRSAYTTTRYAKVDIDALSEIAQPWPGMTPC